MIKSQTFENQVIQFGRARVVAFQHSRSSREFLKIFDGIKEDIQKGTPSGKGIFSEFFWIVLMKNLTENVLEPVDF